MKPRSAAGAAVKLRKLPPLLALFAALHGCDAPDEPAFTEGCDSTRQCLYNQVCDVLQHRCVSEPQNGVQGQFFCQQVFGETVTAGNGVGSFSEVVGNVNLPSPKGGRALQRMNLISPALCQLVDGTLHVLLFDPDLSIKKQGYHLHLFVPAGQLQAGPFLDLTSQDDYRACASVGTAQQLQAAPCEQSGDLTFKIAVDRFPQVGQPLLGYVEITFQDIEPQPQP